MVTTYYWHILWNLTKDLTNADSPSWKIDFPVPPRGTQVLAIDKIFANRKH